jgi:hypothetical protein
MPIGLGSNFNKPWPTPLPSRSPALDARLRRTRQRLVATQGGVHPSQQISSTYRRRLISLIDEMHNSVKYWLGAKFKAVEPQRELLMPNMAYDATAAEELQREIKNLTRRWSYRFDKLAERLAAYFSQSVRNRSDADLKRILKKSGMSIEFQMTKPMREAVDAIVHENVSLIKSIPQQYLGKVEGATMRSVLAGRDTHQLYEDIRATYGVTKRRAELIARDQTQKATSALQQVRYQEIGIEKAIWMHSHAGRDPRKSHVANDGKEYTVATGWYDPDEQRFIRPSELINCFPGTTKVSLGRGVVVEKLWRSPFNGKVVDLVAGGSFLQPTFNHPILTRNGWCSANSLEVGDDIVCVVSENRDVVAHQEGEFVTSFSNLFEACVLVFGNTGRSGVSFDFHGDIPDGEVDEVTIDFDLLRKLDFALSENVCKFDFTITDRWIEELTRCSGVEQVSMPNFSCLCDVLFMLLRSSRGYYDQVGFSNRTTLNSAEGEYSFNVGSGDTKQFTELGGSYSSSIRHANSKSGFGGYIFDVRSGLVGGSSFGPLGDNESSPPEIFANFIRRIPNNYCGVFDFGSSLYQFYSVVEKSIRNWSGHIFTMQTNLGYYTVGDLGVVSKNCRCFSKPILP